MSDTATQITPPAEDQPQTPPAETQPADGKSNHLLQTSADGVDPDEQEMKDALAAVEAEGNGATPGTETPAAAVTPPAGTTETPPATAPAAGTMIPLAAAQADREKRQAAERDAAYWRGVAEGRFPQPQKPAEGQTRHEPSAPAPSDDKIKDLRTQQRDLARQVDEGKLSTEEYEQKRGELDDQISAVRDARVLERAKDTGQDLYLSTLTEDLESKNTWLNGVPADELVALMPFAQKELEKAGFNINAHAGTALGDFRMREAVVHVAKKFGFDRTYGAGAPTGAQTSPTPAASAAPGPGAGKTAPNAADVTDKLELAKLAPPRPVGTGAPADTWTQDRVENMDSKDLEDMPMHQLKQIGERMDREAASTRVSTAGRR